MYKNFSCLLIFYISSVFSAVAVPAFPYPIKVTQPDGTILTVQLRGNEFNKIRLTTDGYVIKKNEEGFYTYAIRDEQGEITAGEIRAKDPDKRTASEKSSMTEFLRIDDILLDTRTSKRLKIRPSPKASSPKHFPKMGTPKGLVILVNFADLDFVTPNPQEAFDNLLNREDYSDNGATGSVRDYFRASSYGKFNPRFDVVGPYTLPQNMAYYGKNNAAGDDVKPAYMVVDACKEADMAGLNFTSYDNNGDDYIDNVFIIFAGHNEAESDVEDAVWPHHWEVSPGYNYLNNTSLIRFDGKKVSDYACTSELTGGIGSEMCGIGTFAHEFGHVIGLPDYYHTEENKITLGHWDIMDEGAYLNGGKTPPVHSAYNRFFLGWLTPEELDVPADKTLFPLSQLRTPTADTQKQAYLLAASPHNLKGDNPSPKEFYIMEYRKKNGWDSFLPEEGLLFWHIDYDKTAWSDNKPNNYRNNEQTADSHMRVYLQPLSGYSTTPGNAFESGSFTPLSWSGTDIDRPITDITKTPDSISFKIKGGNHPGEPNEAKIKVGKVRDNLQFPLTKVNTDQLKYLNIKTKNITGELTLNINGPNADCFSVSMTTVSEEDANSVLGINIKVVYKPLTAENHTAYLTISGGGLNPEKIIRLSGVSSE